MDDNRFCFVAIVRDESKVIERCLTSVKNLATSYIICDTGSKDDTIVKIQTFMHNLNIPGEVIQREWISYGENKSELLAYFRAHPRFGNAKYFCWLDADEVFIMDKNNETSYPTKDQADALFNNLESRKENIFMMKTLYGPIEYWRWQIARNDQLYVWKLPYQEFFTGTVYESIHNLTGMWNLSKREGNSSNDPDIYPKRIKMSEAWIKKYPNDPEMPRMLFYLAEAYQGIDNERAKQLYRQRLDMVGGYQEKYIALLRFAKLLDDKYEKIALYHRAIDMCPQRLEAYYHLLIIHFDAKDYKKAAGVATMAPHERDPPEDAMFVERQIYDSLFDINAAVSYHITGDNRNAIGLTQRMFDRKTCHSSLEALVVKNMNCFITSHRESTGIRDFQKKSILPAIIVVENFYEDPHKVREAALKLPFNVKGNYPGARTIDHPTQEMREKFEHILGRKITYWPSQYNGSFQYTLDENKSWIHRDKTDFGVVVYLTPNAPLDGGTVLYRHKSTGLQKTITQEQEFLLNNDGNDESLWEVVDRIGNKFNRAIIFQGKHSHKSDRYFGTNLETARLFQTFFFDVASD